MRIDAAESEEALEKGEWKALLDELGMCCLPKLRSVILLFDCSIDVLMREEFKYQGQVVCIEEELS